MHKKAMQRIGIFSGTFDPVHKGHISFALQAIAEAGLDKVVFIPEPRPRYKHEVTHIRHRIAMLEVALKDQPKLSVVQLPDKQFTVKTSLPRIKRLFPDSELLLLVGSDVLKHMPVWPHVHDLLDKVGLVVGARDQTDERQALKLLSLLPTEPAENHIIITPHKMMAARNVRARLRAGEKSDELLPEVAEYAETHSVYTSVAGSAKRS